jgi:hypothetical protein
MLPLYIWHDFYCVVLKMKRIQDQLPKCWTRARDRLISRSNSSSSTTSTEKVTQISGLFSWNQASCQLNKIIVILLRGSSLTCLTTTSLPSANRHAYRPRSKTFAPSSENLSMMKSTCLVKRLVTPTRASLKRPPLYSLISVYPFEPPPPKVDTCIPSASQRWT